MKECNRLYALLVLAWFSVAAAVAQIYDPVKGSAEVKELQDGTAELLFHLTISSGWHVYNTNVTGGATPATFHSRQMVGAEPVGPLTAQGRVLTAYDEQFGAELQFFEGSVTFVQKIKFTAKEYQLNCYVQYGACTDRRCMPPSKVELTHSGVATSFVERSSTAETRSNSSDRSSDSQELRAPEASAAETAAPLPPQDSAATADSSLVGDSVGIDSLDTVAVTVPSFIDESADGDAGMLSIFLAGLLGGLLALLTPCVWPIIPMTVSFFLKRNKERGKAVREALTYGLSIIVIYVLLGMLVTLLFGANALNALSTNAWFNIFFALLLVVFAASFFGAFELTLPQSWANKVDRKSEQTTGLLSIFLMAFTLALVSFSCTGPIIGFLLVAVGSQGELLGPTLGMFGFAVGLAIPFALFALFPSLLKSAPRSGGWMNVVKVTLGFIELAFALKFFSIADLAYGWRLLDREVFLTLWIAIFTLLGLYLLGVFHFAHDDEGRRTNVPQFFGALASLAFAIYMVPGLWGAPLKAISAFAPPMFTQDFKMNEKTVEARFNDYEAGMAYAREQGKPVMIDFTGFGCTNCRKMEGAVWTDPEVARLLTEDYVLISLYVDDKTPLAQPIDVVENGQHRQLYDVGDRWSYFQRAKFGANTQPFYVLLDNEGRLLSGSRSYDEDISAYVEWLRGGLKRYQDGQ